MKRQHRATWALVGLLVVGLIAGCGSDGGNGGADTSSPAGTDTGSTAADTGGGDEIGQTYTQAITAADGGTLTTPSGSAVLTVPPGALTGDTDLTLLVEAASGDAQTNIFDFGPSGTTFGNPVSLSIAYAGTPPEGKTAVLAVWENDAWSEIEGSVVADGKVSGAVDHFSRFTVIFTDAGAVVVANCDDSVANFTPCGGDVLGTWGFESMCLSEDFVMAGSEPSEQCPDAYLEFELVFNGTLTFTATEFTRNLIGMTITTSNHTPTSCLTDILQMTCAEWEVEINEGEDDPVTCVEADGICVCTSVSENNEGNTETVPYTIDGNEIVSQETSGERRTPFCRTGDTLVAENVDMFGADTGTIYMILNLQ